MLAKLLFFLFTVIIAIIRVIIAKRMADSNTSSSAVDFFIHVGKLKV